MKSCDTSVDKVVLIARWLVIHTRKQLVFTRLDTRNMFLEFVYVVFLFIFGYLCTKLSTQSPGF